MAGCVWAPGQSVHLSSGKSTPQHVDLVPITPQLIASDATSQTGVTIPAALLDYKPAPYRIGSGDILYITVWDHPELTSPAGSQQETNANGRLVRPDGTIYYPFAGEVHAAGMTIEQLRELLAQKLGKFITRPQVDVSVITYGSQHVLMEGAFLKGGAQPITDVPLTLGEAMATAGVDDLHGDLGDVLLVRDGHVYHVDMNGFDSSGGAGRIYLEPGDRVILPYNNSQQVYVMGEVTRPTALTMQTATLTLTQAIGEAGGLSEVTSQGKIYVIRSTGGTGATVYELDAKSPVAFALADQFKVHPGDVVFASAAGITRWNRFLTQLLPITSAISATAASEYYVNHP